MNIKSARRLPTMGDVGKAAGVSAMTVSRCLRNDSRQNPKTRERVQALARKMGYKPNPLVSLFNANTRHSRRSPIHATIGLVNSGLERRVAQRSRFAAGVYQRAAEFGYSVDEFHANDPKLPERDWEKVFRSRGLAGLVFLPMAQPHDQSHMDLSGFACAAIGYTLETPNLHRVVHNHFFSLRLAVRELLERGYRRIGFVDEVVQQERVRRLHLAAHLTEDYPVNIPFFRLHSAPGNVDDSPFKAWLRRYQPDVLITAEYGLRPLLDRLKITVPKDVALVSLDAVSDHLLTTGIDQMHDLVGGGAIDLVLAQLHRNERGIPSEPKIVLTGGKWVDGKNCMALPKTPLKVSTKINT